MFEHHKQALISREAFFRRVGWFVFLSLLVVGISWLIGIFGYHELEHMSWIDATVNAAMILGGMGPVNPLYTNAGKWFASFYALFSGMIFLVSVGILVAPVIHRIMHKFHHPEK